MPVTNPLVSLIMPIYNVEHYIGKSIQSVIYQTYKNIELILVDDGSTDNSVKIAEDILKNAEHPYQLIKQRNLGQGEARNTGIRASHGEWLYFLDSDDRMISTTIERMVKAIAKNVDVVFSEFDEFYNDTDCKSDCSELESVNFTAEQLQYAFLVRSVVVLAPGTLYKKSMLIENNISFEAIPWSEDQHFVWQVLRFARCIVYIKAPFYQYFRHHIGSIMNATGVRKMEESYPSICKLNTLFPENSVIHTFLVPRWVIGTMNSAAGIIEYKKWITLFKKIDGKRHFRSLLKFPKSSIRIAAFFCLISPKIYYNITRLRTKK